MMEGVKTFSVRQLLDLARKHRGGEDATLPIINMKRTEDQESE